MLGLYALLKEISDTELNGSSSSAVPVAHGSYASVPTMSLANVLTLMATVQAASGPLLLTAPSQPPPLLRCFFVNT
jgi:hypothetical protein